MRRLAAAIAITAGLAGAQDAAAAAKPDLTITKVTAAPAVVQGRPLAVSDTVRNVGRGRAKAAQVAYLLSKDAQRSKGDRALGGRRAVKALPRGKAAKGARTVAVPATLAVGAYRLIACVDPAGKVHERNERNNCRAAARPVQVIAPGGPAQTPAVIPAPGPSPAPDPTPTPTAGPTVPAPAFPQTPDPIKVTDTLEATGLTQKMFGGFENSMTVTGADGTVYTLTMPKDALLTAVDVTMTPVDAVNGLPLTKGLVAAVRLEPHGLQLQKPATLTIEPPAGTPVAEQTAFLYHQGGHDFHLYPLGPERTLTMRLMHFSTPGVGLAAPGDRAGVLDNPPARPGAQLEQAASEGARQDRASGLGESAGDSPAVPDPSAVFPPYYDNVVKPKLVAAETNDALAREAIAEALSWARNAELMGMEDDPEYQKRRDEMMVKIEAIIRNAVEQAFARCVDDHELEEIVKLASLARIAALMGFDFADEAFDKFQRCANFEVRFDSKITSTNTWSGGGGEGGLSFDLDALWQVKSTIPIDFLGFKLNHPLTWADFSYESTKHDDCGDNPDLVSREKGVSTAAGTMTAVLSMDLNPREPALEGQPAPDPPEDYLLLSVPTAPKETYQHWTEGCTSSAPTQNPPESRWDSRFDSFHVDSPLKVEIARGAQLGALIDSQRWQQQHPIDMGSLGGGADVEDTIVEIWHEPLP